jgi:hyperosmotically inducible protein
MKREWLKQSRDSIIVLVAAAIFPVLTFASGTVGNAANDTVITGKVKSSLAINEVTHAQGISVETNDGVVTLSGTTESATEAAQAVEIAESTVGVKGVDTTQLFVKDSNQPMTDTYITAKIKGTFLKNNLTPGELNVPLVNVKVETQRGIVYLRGTVKNARQRAKLIRLAKSVDGVSEVKTTIEIKGE